MRGKIKFCLMNNTSFNDFFTLFYIYSFHCSKNKALTSCNLRSKKIYKDDEIWGHLDAFRDVVKDDVKCDAYISLTPNIYFHNSICLPSPLYLR